MPDDRKAALVCGHVVCTDVFFAERATAQQGNKETCGWCSFGVKFGLPGATQQLVQLADSGVCGSSDVVRMPAPCTPMATATELVEATPTKDVRKYTKLLREIIAIENKRSNGQVLLAQDSAKLGRKEEVISKLQPSEGAGAVQAGCDDEPLRV